MTSDGSSEMGYDLSFRRVLRGFDPAEVEAHIAELWARLAVVEAEREEIASQIGAESPKGLEADFDAVGHEVTAILQSAREAADAMRERATADAARWRSEAMAEAEESRREAAADAEALRRDAWATGTELLSQAQAYAQRIREQAERDVLTTMGEAEREAHRLTSGARRDAEDLLRGAAMDAEKMTSEAAKRRDEMIEAANRQASAAQERTRALEQRRDELLEELENVRTTLTRLEGSLEERREGVDHRPTDTSSVKVIPSKTEAPPEEKPKDWELGETVRVVKAESRIPKLPEPSPLDDDLDEEEQEAEPVVVEPDHPEIESTFEETDDVESLFASLRGGQHEEGEPGEEEPESVSEPEPPAEPAAHDWLEERDSRLLPVTNRALRGIKKSITELQNIALDNLRTDEAWRPDAAEMADTLAADLIGLWAESFAAGHAVAEQMTGAKIKRPATPHSDSVAGFSAGLAGAVVEALDSSGKGQRERQSAASRVFRIWRSDEAEQRVRGLAIKAYEEGVERSVAIEV